MKLVFVALLVLTAVVGVWAGGGKEEAPASEKETKVVKEKAPEVKEIPQVLNFAMPGNPDTLDPAVTSGTLTFQTLKSVYDSLAEPDKEGNIIPALAESWDVSEDGISWTFRLRKGVVFHNGDPLTSADVKATFERMLKEETASPHVGSYGVIAAIDTPDDLTVIFTLKEAFSPFLAALASGWGAILPKSLIDSGHDFASKPVGTGPFVMKEWVRDNRIVFEKNPNYWKPGLPKLDRVNLNIITESTVQVQSLMAGQNDIQFIVDSDDLPMLESDPNIVIEKNLTSLIFVIAMNCENEILSDLRVRQAINHAIDKQAALDVAYGGGNIIGTFMDYSNYYYKDFTSFYPYDPAKAKALLAEAGVTADDELEMFLPQNYPLHVRAGEIYQEMLSKVGLNVKLRLVDWSTWISDVYRGGKYDLTVIAHTGKLDPNGTLTGYGAGKYVKWYNDEAAALINDAVTVSDPAERKAMYDKALEIMAREVPFVYIGSSSRFTAYNKKVKGFQITPNLDTFDFRWTEIVE